MLSRASSHDLTLKFIGSTAIVSATTTAAAATTATVSNLQHQWFWTEQFPARNQSLSCRGQGTTVHWGRTLDAWYLICQCTAAAVLRNYASARLNNDFETIRYQQFLLDPFWITNCERLTPLSFNINKPFAVEFKNIDTVILLWNHFMRTLIAIPDIFTKKAHTNSHDMRSIISRQVSKTITNSIQQNIYNILHVLMCMGSLLSSHWWRTHLPVINIIDCYCDHGATAQRTGGFRRLRTFRMSGF